MGKLKMCVSRAQGKLCVREQGPRGGTRTTPASEQPQQCSRPTMVDGCMYLAAQSSRWMALQLRRLSRTPVCHQIGLRCQARLETNQRRPCRLSTPRLPIAKSLSGETSACLHAPKSLDSVLQRALANYPEWRQRRVLSEIQADFPPSPGNGDLGPGVPPGPKPLAFNIN